MAVPRVAVLRSNVNSIFANLAAEEALTHARADVRPALFLWRNSPTVVIGRHQNPWKECQLTKMDMENVALSRRYSGGGAVYHDMGCSIFTFINRLDAGSNVSRIIDSNFEILTRSLNNLGFNATRKGRNDIVVDDSTKISGSAFKQNSTTLIHHGTILVNTDLTKLSQYLTPSKLKIESKGISSVRARVSNLSDLPSKSNLATHDHICNSLTGEFRNHYECSSAAPPSEIELTDDPVYNEHLCRLQDWSWRFGSSPEFSHNLETRIDGVGCFDVHFQVNNGTITKVVIFSDILYPELIDSIQTTLTGSEYRPESVVAGLDALCDSQPTMEKKTVLKSFRNWLIREL
jgi:lipoate---protein ligase